MAAHCWAAIRVSDEAARECRAAFVFERHNYYELSRKKEEPVDLAHTLKPAPWTISVEGEVAKPGRYAIEDLTTNY